MKLLTATTIAVILFLYLQNNWLQTSRLTYVASRLPQGFDGFRIAQLSDLHCKEFGKDNKALLAKLKKLSPDIVVITGDLISAGSFYEKKTLKLLRNLEKIAPAYYVTGNHEIANPRFPILEKKIHQTGVRLLRNSIESLRRNGEKLDLIGVDDSGAAGMSEMDYTRWFTSKKISQILEDSEESNFRILLTHRPELFDIYTENSFDMIFSGHAHGGQIRLPFIGGLAAPGQGYLPAYTSGMYTDKSSVMVVSRGLGNSSFPQRIFNRPEIVVVTLKHKD